MKKHTQLTRPAALVVDDNPICRRLVAGALDRRGFEVIVAGDGFEAIRALSSRAQELALLIVDTEMPGVHGWEVIRFARGKVPRLPILRLGRRDDEAPGADYQALKSVPMLPKPFTVAELLARLRPRTRRPCRSG